MARRKRGSKRRARENRSEDWSDNLSGKAWKFFQALPVIGEILSAFREDPTAESLSTIAEHVGDIALQLSDQQDVLQALQTFFVNQGGSQNEMLEDICDMLQDYTRLDLIGQLSGYSILTVAVAQIKRLADMTERMANSLKSIDENLTSINTRGEYFPENVHSFLKMKILDHCNNGNDGVPHYFTVFNKGTLWHPKFAEIQRSDPLGPRYLGHKTDLDELCAFLAEEVRPRVGPAAVLHVLMPTIGQLALCEAVRFPEGMRPFIVEGQLGNGGAPFVYICTTEQEDKACLRDVGVLKPRELWELSAQFAFQIPFIMRRPFVAFPGRILFIDPAFRVSCEGGNEYQEGLSAWYSFVGLEPTRTLGQRVTVARPWL